MQISHRYPGRLLSNDNNRSPREVAKDLFERAAQFRTMAREIMAMADEAETEAMGMVGSNLDGSPVKAECDFKLRERLLDAAQYQYKSRRVREKYFSQKFFGEPGWDMLLDLYIAELNDKEVSASNLVLASSAPNSTACRWIKQLEDAGLIMKRSCSRDGRIQYKRISQSGFSSMNQYLKHIDGL